MLRKVTQMRFNANAKINLSLDVCSKRDDGYHNVEMIMQEVSFCDCVDIELNESNKINLNCDTKVLGSADKTLTYRAAKLFFENMGAGGGCDISLVQNIPACSGLGGGSADAAAVLNGLNILHGNVFTKDELCRMGVKLGADVPFCVAGGTALSEGIGEILTPIESKIKKWVALIKPTIDISTPEAYRIMDETDYPHPNTGDAVCALETGDMELFSKSAFNCFEYVMGEKYPVIGEIKKYFYDMGAQFSMMSGSGPTVFALFDKKEDAENAFGNYKKPFSGGGVGEFVIL